MNALFGLFRGFLLIEPCGIEIREPGAEGETGRLLIEPCGIEIDLCRSLDTEYIRLLIEPCGIEIEILLVGQRGPAGF